VAPQRETAEDLLKAYVSLVVTESKRVREADISDGSRVKHGSRKHVKDLEARIQSLSHFRDKHRKGTEKRAEYSRLIGRLKSELASAKRSTQGSNDRT
jgi:hypothetical protein